MNTAVSVASLASASAVVSPALSAAPLAPAFPRSPSPAAVAIERLRAADVLFDRLYDELDLAQDEAASGHGRRPFALIAWRNYSHIGGTEIDGARDRFLAEGNDGKIVEQEYRGAKKRYQAAIKSGKDWDRRTGLDGLTKSLDAARVEMHAARDALGTVKLHSVADAAELIDHVHGNIEQFDSAEDWEIAALGNARKFLVTHSREDVTSWLPLTDSNADPVLDEIARYRRIKARSDDHYSKEAAAQATRTIEEWRAVELKHFRALNRAEQKVMASKPTTRQGLIDYMAFAKELCRSQDGLGIHDLTKMCATITKAIAA